MQLRRAVIPAQVTEQPPSDLSRPIVNPNPPLANKIRRYAPFHKAVFGDQQ
jgi:hypothetical protein